MASKREEERNEKIIRGLMKLPPNRRCINCNSLGPQYVCTNFWTFICMICSGIHREFTHRVKSVSMSKFTSQEVEALQNGGNQRAREIFLKDWDVQRQRLPNSSNVDKVREFIKAVYVDRKYAGGNKPDKLPRDTQSESNIGDETRRASSYHSYSQSPPYDFQYEERLTRKQGGALARKPGSGLFERKAVSFAYSPGRLSDHMYEDRFANEGYSSRVSDYSVSSGGDPFRSGPHSPNLQKDEGLSSPQSPNLHHQTTSASPEAYAKRDADRYPVPRPQRTVSSGNFVPADSNSASHQSVDSGNLFDAYSEPKPSAATTQNKLPIFPSFSQPSTGNYGALNFFEDPLPAPNAAPVIDLFQAPTGSSSVDLFQTPANSSALPQNVHVPQTSLSSSSSHLNETSQKSSQPPSVPIVNQRLPEPSDPSNVGWATFDLPQHNASISSTQGAVVLGAHLEAGISFTNSNPGSSSTAEMQWPDFQTSVVHVPASSVSNPWNEPKFYNPVNEPDNQPWKAFEDDNDQHKFVNVQQGGDLQVSQNSTSSTSEQHLGQKASEGLGVDGLQKLASGEGASFSTLTSHFASGSSFNPPLSPFMSETAHVQQKSANPFDIDSELEASNVFMEMSSLQVALPGMPLPSPFVGGINESWFPSSPVASQGGMPYMTAPPSSSQLPNVSAHGPVASIGGNPFA